MKVLHQQFGYLVHSLDRNYVPTVYSFMNSVKNGPEQAPHRDYTPDAVTKIMKTYPQTISWSMIVALEARTRLKVFDCCFTTVDPSRALSLELYPGKCLLCRGDLMHCGVAYKRVNHRNLCYVTVPGVKFVPDILAGVNEKELKRQFCGYIEVDSQATRTHRFYCKDNPKAANGARVHVRNRRNRPKKAPPKCPRCEKWYSAGGYRKHKGMSPPCVPKRDNI
ncbi:hypothetical protein PR001_g23980 [Phytophthora rubi]|uniref:Uncharacterized protein n=1 Tax=Phytophthora rubi TaxID=129364 RepID=A0A6A3IHN9_9STRA|nr:hypothetical protein PR001_g23980 [Phytophthora rubi]KAE8981690.1 hypothetical protein PR002_g23752 [Phytophthora rubi]